MKTLHLINISCLFYLQVEGMANTKSKRGDVVSIGADGKCYA